MIDFRSLNYFLVACEHENLGAAAKTLGIAPSTLSASLKSLETSFGVSLFRKQGAGLSPRRLAHWLYRAAVPILLLEGFARRRVVAPADAEVSRLHIDIRLRFAFGQFRAALSQAIAATAEAEPLTLVDPQWPLGVGASFGPETTDCLEFDHRCTIVIDAVPRDADEQGGEIALRTDPWMIARRQIGLPGDVPTDIAGLSLRERLMIPAFPTPLIDQVSRWAHEAGVSVQLLEAAPRDWPQLLDDHPGAALLLPASAIGTRLGVTRIDVSRLDPPIGSTIVARSDGHPLAARFLDRLKAVFDANGTATPLFAPALTGRRIHYFNLAHELGRVSAAARAASVAQPALSQQLHKLEESLGLTLFDRRRFGLVRTKASTRFALATGLLDQRLREVEVSGKTALLAEGGQLSLGVLPSVSHHGHLINRITDAVLALRDRYPAMRISVREAPNGSLQKWVLRGRVGLAIVETAPPQMPRLALDATEDLAVVVDPRHKLFPPGAVRLRSLMDTPLALPTVLFGLRQVLDAAVRNAGIELHPRHEIDSLTMLIALLAREPIATVLPASAVKAELASGELCAHPIIEPILQRRLFVIYSGDRSLTAAERELVALLREHLAQKPEEAGDAGARTG